MLKYLPRVIRAFVERCEWIMCYDCQGQGVIYVYENGEQVRKPCTLCNGSGEIWR